MVVARLGRFMREPYNPLPRGHCSAIRRKCPFRIGEDFQAPTPVARVRPRIKLPEKVLNELEECLGRSKAEVTSSGGKSDLKIYRDACDHLALVNGVNEALAWYISDWECQPSEREIRTQLKKLEKRIDRFKVALPVEHGALGTFIRDTYTGTAFLKDSLKPAEGLRVPLQDAWRERYGLPAISEQLDVMKDYVTAAKECLGKKRPLEHRKAALVRALARTWRQLTGHWPTSGRSLKGSRQTGPFADFVRMVCSVLPEDARPDPLDAVIRRTCDARRQR
jgi:hypothetical protein